MENIIASFNERVDSLIRSSTPPNSEAFSVRNYASVVDSAIRTDTSSSTASDAHCHSQGIWNLGAHKASQNKYPNEAETSIGLAILPSMLFKHKFAYITANQAIFEAFATAGRIHVIDFSLKLGMQWAELMIDLASQPGGPFTFRLSGIGPPQADNTDTLQSVGWKLAKIAEAFGIGFEFRGFICENLADLEPNMFQIRPGEALAINSVFDLNRMLCRPGSVDKVLDTIKKLKPKIITIVEQKVNHTDPFLHLLNDFVDSLHGYSIPVRLWLVPESGPANLIVQGNRILCPSLQVSDTLEWDFTLSR